MKKIFVSILCSLCSIFVFAQKYYSSVAEMVADRSLKEGMVATTTGYWAVNDGGNASYTIVRKGDQNGGDMIKLQNGLYASMIYDGRTFNLKQWGIKGDLAIRYVKEIYPFLSDKDIKAINSKFSSKTTAETYIIQYLINKKPNNIIIVLDGNAYYISNTIHLKPFMTIKGVRSFDMDSFGQRLQMPGNKDACTSYTSSTLMMITPNEDMFDSGEKTLQNLQLESFNATGVMGKNDFKGKYSGDFFKQTSIISNVVFKNLGIFYFNNGFSRTQEWLWSMFKEITMSFIRYNGFFFGGDGKSQANCNTFSDCRVSRCGYDYSGGSLKVAQLKKPDMTKGNCIVLGGSGNRMLNCDFSHSAVGVYLQSYSNGTSIVGTYSEGNAVSVYYMDYDVKKSNLDTKIEGGFYNVGKGRRELSAKDIR